MTNPSGRVISIATLEVPPHAIVEVDATPACARCAEGRGCGAGLLAGSSGVRHVNALIRQGVTVHEGDAVRVELKPSSILQASLVVYGLPLGGALAGATLAFVAGSSEPGAALIAMGGLVAGFLAARLRLRRGSCLQHFTPTIVERLPASR